MDEDSKQAMTLENSEITRAPKTGTGGKRKMKTRIRHSKTMENGRKSKSKFAEYLEMEKGGAFLSKEEDLRLEKKLAKKLKVKNGMLGGNDELTMLLEGIPSVLDTVDGYGSISKSLQDCSSHEKQKKSNHAVEEIKPEKGSASMDGLFNSLDPGSDEFDNVEELSLSKVTKKRKTKSEEYSEMGKMHEGDFSAAKTQKSKRKFKVSEGKLCEDNDDANKVLNEVSEPVKNDHGINVTLERVPTAVPDLAGKTKYVAPHLRSCMKKESEDNARMRKRVRGTI